METKNGGSFDSSNTTLGDANASSPEKMALVPCETTELKSEPSEAFVVVGGYKVKKELAPLVAAIFRKHGNIVRGCSFSMESRWCLLELVCTIYNKLQASNMSEMKHSELKSIYLQVRDLERVKVKVGWLRERLKWISENIERVKVKVGWLRERLKWISENIETYRAAKARSVAALCQKKKEVEARENELEELMAAAKKLQERLQEAKDEQSAAMSLVDEINSLSLVHGLV